MQRLLAPIAVFVVTLSACGGDGHPPATTALPNLTISNVGGPNIYISNSAANNVVTYTAAGKATKPTITNGINDPGIIAVDAKGNI